MKGSRRSVSFFVAVLILCAAILWMLPRSGPLLQFSIDFTNWRIFMAESIQLDDGGLTVKSRTSRHFGPLTISTERLWTQEQAHPVIGGNGDNF